MPSTSRLLYCLPLIAALLCPHASAEQRSLSQGWLFKAGAVPGAQQAAFDDKGWRHVTVPHDFSIMDKDDGAPPFDPRAIGGQDSGYLPGGQGWYRHRLDLSAVDAAR